MEKVKAYIMENKGKFIVAVAVMALVVFAFLTGFIGGCNCAS